MIRKKTRSTPARTSRILACCSYDRLESRQLLTANRPPTFYLENGIVIDEIGSFDDMGSDVAVQPDGKIVVVGASSNGTNFDFSIVRYLPNGNLDSSFGVGGKVITPVGTYDDFAEKVVIQSDGRIVVAGRSAYQNTFDFAVVRYLANGSLDTSFSGDGMLSTNILGDDQAFGVAIQPDGKVLVAGSADSGGDKDFALVRYRTDGALDTSFGNGGKVTTAVGTFSDIAESVLLQPDGKIILAGRSSYYEMYDFALARYNTNGSLDTSFSGDGLVSTNILGDDHAYAAALQPDGKILLAGYSDPGNDPDFAVVRYQSNGSLDSTFGSGGRVTTAVGSQRDIGTCMRLQPDGKILVGGKSDYFGMNNFAMVRYRLDGSLDPSLDSDGKLATHLLGDDQPYGMALQSDGKVLLAGYMYSGRTIDYALVRYASSGALDSVFGGNFNTLGGTIDYTEGASPVRIDVDVQVYDPELTVYGYFNGATLTINRSGGPSNNDVFSAIGYLQPLSQGGNLIVGDIYCGTVTTNSNGTLLLTFNSAATNGAVNAVLQQIAYSNSSDNPPNSVDLTWVFNDGNTGNQGTGGPLATSGSVTVFISSVNDPPTLDALNNLTINEDAAQQTVNLAGITAGGGESQPLRVTASSNNTGLIPTPTVNYTSANTTGSISFTPVANQSGVATITVSVEDGGLDGNLNTTNDNATFSRTFTVTVTPPPEITVAGPVGPISENNSGNQTVYFTVSLTAASTETVKVNYATTVSGYGSPATPGNDFTPVSGLIEFAPGETTKSIPVLVRGDRSIELDELFGLLITNPVNGQLGVDLADLIITDDDSWSLPQEIDFGTEVSPLKSGAVALGALPFTSAKSLGWTAGLNNLQVVDRGFGSAGLRDIALTSNSSFAFNVPNGTYILRLTFGDATKSHDQMRVTIEGSNKPLINTAVNQFTTRIFTTTVSDGRLDLTFADMGGADPQVALAGIAFGRR